MKNAKLLASLATIAMLVSGCGGGGSSGGDANAQPQSKTAPQPAAAFTAQELMAHPFYTTASPATNLYGYISQYTFKADGTVTEAINMSSADPATASNVLKGTYAIGGDGVLTITIPGRAVEKNWKTSASIDSYQSYFVKSDDSTVTLRWFFDASLGGAQAYAYAHGQTLPISH